MPWFSKVGHAVSRQVGHEVGCPPALTGAGGVTEGWGEQPAGSVFGSFLPFSLAPADLPFTDVSESPGGDPRPPVVSPIQGGEQGVFLFSAPDTCGLPGSLVLILGSWSYHLMGVADEKHRVRSHLSVEGTVILGTRWV